MYMQELLLKMGGGVYAEGGVFAGFYGALQRVYVMLVVFARVHY